MYVCVHVCVTFSYLAYLGRLQTGMRHAFGKAIGVVARVKIGQPLISVRCKEQHKHHVLEALRRCKYKFPGRQHIVHSNKWGFTKLTKAQFRLYADQGRLIKQGVHVDVRRAHGPLTDRSILVW